MRYFFIADYFLKSVCFNAHNTFSNSGNNVISSIPIDESSFRIEFFDVSKEKVFLELRKNPESLKKFEGKLKVEVFRMEMPILKTFSKPETPILLEEKDVKKFQNGFGDDLKVEINTLGCPKCRKSYREKIREVLKSHLDKLCDDCKLRYEKKSKLTALRDAVA